MREIKFRAWDKKRKRMYEVSDLHLANPMNGGVWATVIGKDIIENKDIKLQIQPKDIDVLQFTGLKDKNGKEIYEGDILGYWGRATWEVLWVNNKCSFRFGNHVTNFPMTEVVKKEVIGNIYENPELLK